LRAIAGRHHGVASGQVFGNDTVAQFIGDSDEVVDGAVVADA
jgi:hypothetical protein